MHKRANSPATPERATRPRTDAESSPGFPDPNAPAPNMSPERGFTAADLIEQQERLEKQAAEAIPYKFDQCTRPMGHIRQPVFACRTCGGGGVCAGCSVACHGDHDLIELFHKRNFMCDCGSQNMYRKRDAAELLPTGYPADATPCSLRDERFAPGSTENVYSHNFDGEFCYCERGKHYDPDTEEDTMYQCLVCEDWLHESCTHRGLIKQSEFDCMICDACVSKPENAVLRDYAGAPGWMVLAQEAEKPEGSLSVIGSEKPDAPVHPVRREFNAPRLDLYLRPDFRNGICRCETCVPRWAGLVFVADEEETYDPPDDLDDYASGTSGSSSYDRALAVLGHLPRDHMSS
ncbi:RING-type E3 ubiquitin transferase [Malassezia cuniculi]|uniref:RING-type E3 ubiquitin transferase n=1 Tax=Malassezia cuniculi TaxID=948313 RepID=A0AAF0EXW9_9BASI|nr:RING-type E3 ubiquitin transferase [Malassezia cuniculi]